MEMFGSGHLLGRKHDSTPQGGVEAPRLLKRSLSRLYDCCCGKRDLEHLAPTLRQHFSSHTAPSCEGRLRLQQHNKAPQEHLQDGVPRCACQLNLADHREDEPLHLQGDFYLRPGPSRLFPFLKKRRSYLRPNHRVVPKNDIFDPEDYKARQGHHRETVKDMPVWWETLLLI